MRLGASAALSGGRVRSNLVHGERQVSTTDLRAVCYAGKAAGGVGERLGVGVEGYRAVTFSGLQLALSPYNETAEAIP